MCKVVNQVILLFQDGIKFGWGCMVVIVDDSGLVCLVFKGLFEECGLKVVQLVVNGGEVIQVVCNYQLWVFCFDINMLVMGGLEVLLQIVEVSL